MTTAYLRSDLRRDEGTRRRPYKDSLGIWTDGVGHNIQADPAMLARLAYLLQRDLTDAEIDALLDHDIAAVCHNLDNQLPWWRGLDDLRQDVLANMAFNLGIAKLLGFKNTLAAIQRHDWATAASHMLQSLWASQVGARSTRLANQMLTGVHQGDDHLPPDPRGSGVRAGSGPDGPPRAGQPAHPGGSPDPEGRHGVLLGPWGSNRPVAPQVGPQEGGRMSRLLDWLASKVPR